MIPGYRAVKLRISGTNPGKDEVYTVIYVQEDNTEYIDMDDYETPLNPGFTDIQIGVCLE